MLQQVDIKIKELKKRQTEEYYKRKDADLRAWGLTTKKDGKKEIPIIVTDDEYEELIKASNGVGATGRNKVAIALNVLSAVIIIVGAIIASVVAGLAENLAFVYFSLILAGSIALGIISKGLGEAVRLLQQIIDHRSTALTEEQKLEYQQEQAKKEAEKANKKASQPEQPVAPEQPIVYTTQPVYAQQPVYPAGAQQVQPVYTQQPVYVQGQPVYAAQTTYTQQPVFVQPYPQAQQAPQTPQQAAPQQPSQTVPAEF